MTSRIRLSLLASVTLAVVFFTARPEAQGATTPAPATDQASTGGSLAGKWKMVVDVESPDRESIVDLQIDGAKVTGTLTAPSGAYPLAGELADGKVVFSFGYQNRRLVFTGTPKTDGTLAGSVDAGDGAYTWTAQRVPEK